MSHPLFLIKRHYEDVNDGKYAQVGRDAEAHWNDLADTYEDVGRFAAICTERIGQLCASKARLVDKVALYKNIIATGVGFEDGALSDDDAVMLLAGWAGEMRKRFVD